MAGVGVGQHHSALQAWRRAVTTREVLGRVEIRPTKHKFSSATGQKRARWRAVILKGGFVHFCPIPCCG